MKLFLLLMALAVFLPNAANAYTSSQGYDPNVCVPDKSAGDPSTGYPSQCTVEREYKDVTKSQTAGYSDQIPAGSPLYYSQGGTNSSELLGLATVSIEASTLAGNDAKSNGLFACILPQTAYTDVSSGKTTRYAGIATGYSAAFQCIVRGYAVANVDQTQAINTGDSLCIGALASTYGYLVPCAVNVTSRIRALQPLPASNAAKTTIGVVIDAR